SRWRAARSALALGDTLELRRSKKMLVFIAALCGAGCAFLLLKGASEDHIGKVFAFSLGVVAAIPTVVSMVMVLRDPVVGLINDTGILMTFWKTGPIAWADIASYSIQNPGEGGLVICLYLRNESHYLSAASLPTRLVGPLRRWIFGTSFVIYAGNIDRKLPDIETEIRKRIQVRARVA
ncbi:MAG: hypothetical protein KF790_12940, partial [Steroidobacteraceae bacterium]|nr:hypothetical protein [Steroidobacteraceae bacterium]